MIQEKDFLYRVPVKTAPITTPRGQIRNPEILVDLEGGEFMHGNILDANSTNKLVNQSVKEAVDNKLNESGCVTKDLLEAETTRATEQENSLKTLIGAETIARTKGDEDLGSKIKAEQTRAEGKEKEISDKLAIVNGDSNTEGSFRKAIAEKADASALANEVSRATGAESGLQAAIATKADATALSNYVLTTALNKQVDTLNTAISAKQDAGNYIPYNAMVEDSYQIDKVLDILTDNGTAKFGPQTCIVIQSNNGAILRVQPTSLYGKNGDTSIDINASGISLTDDDSIIQLSSNGVTLPYGDNNMVLTSNGSTINIGEYATQSDLSAQLGPKADRSDLLTLEKKVTANAAALEHKQPKGDYVRYSSQSDNGYFFHDRFTSSEPFVVDDSYGNDVEYGINGIVASKYQNCLATSDGAFKPISDFASAEDVSSLRVDLSKKQNKITVNTVDITDIETADVTKLRTIVTNLINALISSGLINATDGVE